MAGLLDRMFGRVSYQEHKKNAPQIKEGKRETGEPERTSAQVDKEDFLLKQIDEFREKAKQLQLLLLTKENKVAQLQHIVNEREVEARQLENVLNERKEAAEVLLSGVESQLNVMISVVEDMLNHLAEKIASDVNSSNERTAEQTAEMKQTLEEISKQLDTMKLELAEKIHTEDVKCYRNMADLMEELVKRVEENDKLEKGMQSVKGYVRFLSCFAVLNFIALLGLILYCLGIFDF